MDPPSLVSSLLSSIVSHQLSPCLGDLPMNYPLVFQCFDVLETLGLLTRKSDIQCNQKFMCWSGFKKMKAKYGWVLSKPPGQLQAE